MEKLVKALLLGTAAGIIDVIPMAIQGLSWQTTISTMVHWQALGIIITFARLPMNSWLSGITLALLTGAPLAILTTEHDPTAWIILLLSSIVLGSVLGLMAEKLIGTKRN
ncbi:hypothetical protein [Pseudodesulfovibrio piezophilus]|uniref:Uncharacterized protein n=1 Tax=Pseudodesulfovibrio piezophilus (strain DSM 21447 / JCM 15486 / C1TLV30) TaxID=1322246 RepID=M1WNT4_PSEP2|nr:hypothetical protein [Pseudodesulfovibrio piezophilus]CCH50575.1 conserved membrane protein of unknown function [Pseudodesulfovibrio piezophilus C1TLV30]